MSRKSRRWSGRCARGICAAALVFMALTGGWWIRPEGLMRAQAGTLSGWKFCIDPGHGGEETGAVGPTGLEEKNVNLKVALKLRDLLTAEGAQVLMTREADVAVSINQRWQMANSWGADRFISVHHNAVEDRSVNYTVTLVSTNASQQSLELANSVQAELVGELGLPNRGVWKVSYCGVLNYTAMPAILTEASFISNPAQEQLLRDDAYLAREAQAIFRGIRMPSRVSFIQPRENRISFGEVTVSLQVAGTESVEKVELWVDDALWSARASAPFEFPLDTTGMEDGTHILRAVARYSGGGKASSSRDLIVARAACRWYFAEGTTSPGFHEWLSVLNPNPEGVEITVHYQFPDREAVSHTYRVEADTRMTVQVAQEIGSGHDVSLTVESPRPVVVERPMYFLYGNKWAGGHVSSGTNQPSRTWYFAEGCTGSGFEEWLCLLNPGEGEAAVNVEYFSGGGLLAEDRVTVPSRQRRTLYVNGRAGPDLEISMRVTSDRPVVAERPMYFLYGNKWAGGHVSSGTNQPSRTWYFAEGCTGSGFEEWLCLFNPGPEINRALLTYQISDGTNITDEELIPPYCRRTVNVNQRAGKNLHLSVLVEGEAPLVAERAIYHDFNGGYRGGDVAVGSKSPSRHWFFAEGYTGSGFHNYLCLQNPGPEDVDAEVWIYTESGELLREKLVLPARARTTLYLNSMVPYQEGISVSVHAGGGVVAERPVYFRYLGAWAGGHVCGGYAPGMER